LPDTKSISKKNARKHRIEKKHNEKKKSVADKSKNKASKKKPSSKRKNEQRKRKNIHKDVSPENYFLLVDGSVVKNLQELAESFERMSDDVFYYHVTEFKNDFCNWVEDIFGEKELAEHLREANTIEQAHIAVLKHIIKKLKEL